MNKRGQLAQFSFIVRYPSAIFAAGGILMLILGKEDWAVILIGLGVLLHVMWLRG